VIESVALLDCAGRRYAVNGCVVTAHQFLERVDVTGLGGSNEDGVVELAIHGLLSDMLWGAVRVAFWRRGGLAGRLRRTPHPRLHLAEVQLALQDLTNQVEDNGTDQAKHSAAKIEPDPRGNK
jgi:hypothetical protein